MLALAQPRGLQAWRSSGRSWTGPHPGDCSPPGLVRCRFSSLRFTPARLMRRRSLPEPAPASAPPGPAASRRSCRTVRPAFRAQRVHARLPRPAASPCNVSPGRSHPGRPLVDRPPGRARSGPPGRGLSGCRCSSSRHRNSTCPRTWLIPGAVTSSRTSSTISAIRFILIIAPAPGRCLAPEARRAGQGGSAAPAGTGSGALLSSGCLARSGCLIQGQTSSVHPSWSTLIFAVRHRHAGVYTVHPVSASRLLSRSLLVSQDVGREPCGPSVSPCHLLVLVLHSRPSRAPVLLDCQ